MERKVMTTSKLSSHAIPWRIRLVAGVVPVHQWFHLNPGFVNTLWPLQSPAEHDNIIYHSTSERVKDLWPTDGMDRGCIQDFGRGKGREGRGGGGGRWAGGRGDSDFEKEQAPR